jgi:hypothetical protein
MLFCTASLVFNEERNTDNLYTSLKAYIGILN